MHLSETRRPYRMWPNSERQNYRAGNAGARVRYRATVIPDRTIYGPSAGRNVRARFALYTDEHCQCWPLDEYTHAVVNHLAAYVDGNVHTNGVENFWSLLKRTIGGTYVSVEPYHLFRYVDEQAFRFNNRIPMNDGNCFPYVMRKIVGKRLTYKELTGKLLTPEEQTCPEEPF